MIKGAGIKAGDEIIGIVSPNFRSNGFTLLRAILSKVYGKNWHLKTFRGKKWGDIALEPCIIYHAAILSLIVRFGEKARVKVKGIAHITGGGLPEMLRACFLKKISGFYLIDYLPHRRQWRNYSELEMFPITKLMKHGIWGVGMVLIAENTKKALELLQKAGLKASVIGRVTDTPNVIIASPHNKQKLIFKV